MIVIETSTINMLYVSSNYASNQETGFVRYGNARHPSGMACIMSNGAAAEKRMYVGPKHANEQWTDIMQSHESVVTIDASGYGVFPVNGMSVSVWVNSAAPDRDILHQPL